MGKIVTVSNLKKTLHYLKKNGIRQACYAMLERIETEGRENYTYEPPRNDCLQAQIQEAKSLGVKFSILVPALDTGEEYLRAMIDSVLGQTYGNFELIIADASKGDQVEKVVETYADSRIRYRRLKQNTGISANTNQALMYATGDYAGLLDHDDVLTPDALFEMAACIEKYQRQQTELLLLYSDEDKCDQHEERYFEENRKPDFNLDLILTNNYICHFTVMKRQLMQELGFRSVCDGAQDYDIVLRCLGRILGKESGQAVGTQPGQLNTAMLPVAHIPRVLYHWRCHTQSTAENPASKQYAYDAGKRAVEDFLRSRGWRAEVSHLKHLGFYRIEYQPDLLAVREDVAVVGGKLIDRKNKITGGIYTVEGKPFYQGLHREYSGYMHRASLQQEAEVIDIRCMKASRLAETVLEELTGHPYLQHPETGRYDWRDCIEEWETFTDQDFVDLSRRFCEQVRRAGFRIVWDPAMTEKLTADRKNRKNRKNTVKMEKEKWEAEK